jgi:uncharacterized membrane protein
MVKDQTPPSKFIRRRRIFKSFIAKSLRKRTTLEKIADEITKFSGSIPFLFAHIWWFGLWIILNVHLIPGVKPYDPFPFGLLTMIVSLEAIVLSVFVLLSQNRLSKIESVRNELNLQVNLIAEEEITKVLELVVEMHRKMGLKLEDPEVERMLNRIDTSYIERSLTKQIEENGNNLKGIIGNGNGNKDKKEATEKIIIVDNK